jgi:hypothetical protein
MQNGYFYPELDKVYFKRQVPPMIHVQICQCPQREAQKIADQLNSQLDQLLMTAMVRERSDDRRFVLKEER